MQLREKVSSGKIVSAVATSGEEETDASEFYGSDCVCADGAYSGFASLDYLRRIEPQQQSFASSGAGRFGRAFRRPERGDRRGSLSSGREQSGKADIPR